MHNNIIVNVLNKIMVIAAMMWLLGDGAVVDVPTVTLALLLTQCFVLPAYLIRMFLDSSDISPKIGIGTVRVLLFLVSFAIYFVVLFVAGF